VKKTERLAIIQAAREEAAKGNRVLAARLFALVGIQYVEVAQ
jgi:hypothetical protein